MGTAVQREQVSIWHPWVGTNRFLARMMAVPEFPGGLSRRLGRTVEDHLRPVPNRPARRRGGAGGASGDCRMVPNRVARFDDEAVSTEVPPGPGILLEPMDPIAPPWQIKRSWRPGRRACGDQLDGKSEGVVITRQPPK